MSSYFKMWIEMTVWIFSMITISIVFHTGCSIIFFTLIGLVVVLMKDSFTIVE